MIYHYFGSKELLYRAVLLRRLHQVGTSLSENSQAPVSPDLDPRVSLAEVLRHYFNALTSQPTLPRLLLHACRHYVLGAMALRQGDALRARIHADACIGVGERAGALLPGYIGRLLRLQALADLADAGASLRTEAAQWIPTWSACGMARLAAVAQPALQNLLQAPRIWVNGVALEGLPFGCQMRGHGHGVLR